MKNEKSSNRRRTSKPKKVETTQPRPPYYFKLDEKPMERIVAWPHGREASIAFIQSLIKCAKGLENPDQAEEYLKWVEDRDCD